MCITTQMFDGFNNLKILYCDLAGFGLSECFDLKSAIIVVDLPENRQPFSRGSEHPLF